MRRGDIFNIRLPKGVGHEQSGKHYGVVVQSDALLPRSVVLIAPTSASARSASFRPEIELEGTSTKVLVEQIGAVDVNRLGDCRVDTVVDRGPFACHSQLPDG